MIKKVVKKATLPKVAPASKTAGTPNRVPPRIIKRPTAPAKREEEPAAVAMNEDEALAFAMSIAEEMKRASRKTEDVHPGADIRLSRRPTTRTKGEQTVQFPEADLAEFRKRLLEAREKALTGVDAMKATGFNESDDREADGGDGTNQTLRLQALGQMGSINRTIRQIEEALHRIDDGTYGVCTVCGKLIRKQRLLNQPFVLTCMECQTEMEREKNRGR
ncbi:MAG TPA: hypothetical protein DDY72_00720 [Verrucomicrobia bacterium]|nr:hypothetical protein [Verrucomicrobiota bacterium]